VPGLAKLADAKDVTEKDCRVDCGTSVPVLIAPTMEELSRLTELRTRSAALDRENQQKADQMDADAKKRSKTKEQHLTGSNLPSSSPSRRSP
jgi:hypothetical protein